MDVLNALEPIDSRERHVTTIEEARIEAARLRDADLERDARRLLRDGLLRQQRAEAQAAQRAEQAEARAAAEERGRRAIEPLGELAERINPRKLYYLAVAGAADSRRGAVFAFSDVRATTEKRSLLQRAAHDGVSFPTPAYATGEELAKFAGRLVAVDPTDEELQALALNG